MPRYRVSVCRIAYSNLDIEIKAKNSTEAMQKAEDEGGNHEFPSEHTSKYEAQGCTLIKEKNHVKN